MVKDYAEETRIIKEEAITAINHVKMCKPHMIRFAVTPNDINSIALYIKFGSYETMIFMYGYLFTLSLLEYFVSIEQYERSAQIIESIDRINSTFPNDKPIPRTL